MFAAVHGLIVVRFAVVCCSIRIFAMVCILIVMRYAAAYGLFVMRLTKLLIPSLTLLVHHQGVPPRLLVPSDMILHCFGAASNIVSNITGVV
jgi:hypothetical protein